MLWGRIAGLEQMVECYRWTYCFEGIEGDGQGREGQSGEEEQVRVVQGYKELLHEWTFASLQS